MPTLQQIQLSDSCHKTPTATDECVALPPIKKTHPCVAHYKPILVQLEALKSGYFFKKKKIYKCVPYILIHSKARKSPQQIKLRVHELGPQVNQITTSD